LERLLSKRAAASGREWLVPAGLAALTFLLHLAFYEGYGYFRDELYFLACSEHLDWGYVDQPPGVALAAWASRHVLGDTLLAVRFVPMVFAALQVLLAGLTARAMGGGLYAQALAAICVMAAPIYFGSYLNTDMFMSLGWAACAWVAARILAGGSPRLWLVFGLFAGLALQGKHAIVFFSFAFVVGLALSAQRRLLADPWLWAGAGVAALIAMPNLLWEYAHGWPTYELLSNIARSDKNTVLGPGAYLWTNIEYLSPITLPIWGAGLLWCLFSSAGRRWRSFGVTWVVAFGIFVALKGKGYYLAPVYSTLFCAGAVAIEGWSARTPHRLCTALRVGTVPVVLLGCALLWPFAMPMMPPEKFIAYEEALGIVPPKTETQQLGRLPQQYADMFGWPEMAATVAKVYGSIPPDRRAACGIFANNYGEAGAIDYFGRGYGLPPALSGHQNYWLWGPRGYTGECLIVVGGRRESLESFYNDVVLAAEADHPYAIPYERHLPIWIVRGLRGGSLERFWPDLKHWM
jgi:4-amino-4-deoxy-L-arabinose transferase-like glycosyltransferase